jgi:hypothetical protein
MLLPILRKGNLPALRQSMIVLRLALHNSATSLSRRSRVILSLDDLACMGILRPNKSAFLGARIDLLRASNLPAPEAALLRGG